MLKDYILLINKPSFMTSQDCLDIIKKKLDAKKIGHTGTLDPIATGLMVVLINEATKLSNFILSLDKTYIAKMQLFVRTDTGDITGKVLEQKPAFNISSEILNRVFNHFNDSVYEQEVPIYSAVKKDGKKLYEYARKNQPVDLPIREVAIKNLKLLSYKGSMIEFEVTCSKGTYIRSLIQDMAHSFKTIGVMTSLQRTDQSGFNLSEALELDDINEKSVTKRALTISQTLSKFMTVVKISSKKEVQNIKHGKKVTLKSHADDSVVLLVDSTNTPLAIYQHEKDNIFINKRGFNFDGYEED